MSNDKQNLESHPNTVQETLCKSDSVPLLVDNGALASITTMANDYIDTPK